MGPIKVGRRRALYLTVRFSVPPVATARETFASYSYRRGPISSSPMTGELVKDLQILHNVGFSRSFKLMAGLDVITVLFGEREMVESNILPNR